MTDDKLWKAVLGQLELRVSRGNFLTWFRETRIQERKGDTLLIETPSAFAHEWLSRKYRGPILEIVKSLDTTVQQLLFCVNSHPIHHALPKRPARIAAHKVKQVTVVAPARPALSPRVTTPAQATIVLNHKYTFENFVIGPSNELAYAACKAVATKPGEAYNPLFIYGGVGLGKTHLLQAVANAIVQASPAARVGYVVSEKFINEFVQAIRERNTQYFKERYRDLDVLIIDDVQFLAGKAKTQEELFHTFNALYAQNKQLILSSDRPPKAIPTFEERLRSRLLGGMVVDIQQPDYETRLAILEEKARASTVQFEAEALVFIAKNIQKNVRELEGALQRVFGYCELNNQTATLMYTKKLLEGIIDQNQHKSIDSKQILESVSVYYNVSIGDLCGKSRKQEYVRPRQVAMFILRKENNISFPSIGEQFGGRDHTTAMHACEKIEKLLEYDENLMQDINFIKERLYV